MSLTSEIRKLEQYELHHRSTIERISTLILTAVAVFNMSGLVHDDQRQRARTNRESIASIIPTFNNPAEKNETVRMPIKFDDGLRAIATTGG